MRGPPETADESSGRSAAFVLSLRGVQLADLFQLDAEPMPQGAFRAKFVEQRFGLVEGLGRDFLGLEQVAKAALNLGFGKQGENLQAADALGVTHGPGKDSGRGNADGNPADALGLPT